MGQLVRELNDKYHRYDKLFFLFEFYPDSDHCMNVSKTVLVYICLACTNSCVGGDICFLFLFFKNKNSLNESLSVAICLEKINSIFSF